MQLCNPLGHSQQQAMLGSSDGYTQPLGIVKGREQVGCVLSIPSRDFRVKTKARLTSHAQLIATK